MQAIILCGGLATRLGDTTKTLPKVLLDIADKTVLEWQIRLLKDANVQEVILASGHLHQVLYERVGTHYAGVRVRYAKEEKRLGTGGAIQNAMRCIHTSPFFVLNGDVLLADFSPQQLLDRFYGNMVGLLLSVRVPDIRAYGEIVSDSEGRITAFREKQSVHRAGISTLGSTSSIRVLLTHFPTIVSNFQWSEMFFPMSERFIHYESMPIGLTLGFLSDWRMRDSISKTESSDES